MTHMLSVITCCAQQKLCKMVAHLWVKWNGPHDEIQPSHNFAYNVESSKVKNVSWPCYIMEAGWQANTKRTRDTYIRTYSMWQHNGYDSFQTVLFCWTNRLMHAVSSHSALYSVLTSMVVSLHYASHITISCIGRHTYDSYRTKRFKVLRYSAFCPTGELAQNSLQSLSSLPTGLYILLSSEPLYNINSYVLFNRTTGAVE